MACNVMDPGDHYGGMLAMLAAAALTAQGNSGGGGLVRAVRRVEKDDLNMPNHLLGYRRTFLELRFANVQDLMTVRRDIMPVAEKNRKAMDTVDVYAEVAAEQAGFDLFDDDARDNERQRPNAAFTDASDYIVDIREYDVPYHVRVMIDMSESACLPLSPGLLSYLRS